MILGPPVGYTDLLDFAIEEKLRAEAETPKERHPLRPSAAGFCGRRLAYDLMKFRGYASYPPPPINTPQLTRLFDLGHAVENHALYQFRVVKILQQRYKQQVLTFGEIPRGTEGEAELRREILEGSCDFCLVSPDWRGIGDVKSKKDKFSNAYKTGWDEEMAWLTTLPSVERFSETAFWVEDLGAFLKDLGDNFLCENLYQLNLYACNPFMVERGIDHAFLYRYNKNDSRHMEIRFKPSPEIYDATLAKYAAISRAVDKKEPEAIPRDFNLGSMRCSFCEHKGQCWPDADALKAYFQTLDKVFPKDIYKLVNVQQELRHHFAEFERANEAAEKAEASEQEILKILSEQQVRRIRLDNGHVYAVTLYRSPRPHCRLKRGKV